jgi:hypothetical protein
MKAMKAKGTPFTPTEVIFAPTARCNLACGHCRVDRSRKTALTAEAACAFLEDCAAHGIDRVGFSGGEPFLEPAFLAAVIEKTVDLGLMFDRLMTNGVWYDSDAELDRVLGMIYDAGFDGTIGLSVDDWHGQNPEKLSAFIRKVAELGAENDATGETVGVEIVSVRSREGDAPANLLERTASLLGAKLILEKGTPAEIRSGSTRGNRSHDSGENALNIPILVIPYSAGADDPAAWRAKKWFDDDWCAGPGNVLYVHPDSAVAVCCGFANERPELTVGTVADGVETLITRARATPHIIDCYERGLSVRRRELEASGTIFPGTADDICFFCDWLCGKGHNR